VRLVVFGLGVAIVLAACRKASNPPVAADVTLADSADQVIFDGRFFVTQQGIRRGILRADTIYVFNDNSKVLMKRVRGTFNTETGAPNGTLEGGRGTYDRRLRVLDGYDSVVVTSTDGDRLTSNHLRYTEAKDEISSDSAYTIVRKGDVSHGVGFRSDPNLRDFRCLSQCTGAANVPISTITP
jgi:LPS export ABC transporter protein LptC